MLNQQQLVWRCRRGVRELDVLFTSFLEKEYPNLDSQLQQQFQLLLDEQDPIIMDWLFQRQQPDQALIEIIDKLKNHSGIKV